jgi:hypothetical protein
MLQLWIAVKVILNMNEGATHHGVPAYTSILDILIYHSVAVA